MIGLGSVILIHIVLVWALVTGLAQNVVKAVINKVEAVNIKEKVKLPDEPPPPPPKDIDIPPYVPPPEVSIQSEAVPTITTQTTIPQPEPPKYIAPPAPPQAAPPAAPKGPTSAVAFDARTLAVSEDDYPPSSLRAEEEGVTKVKVTVGANGRVTACVVSEPSGHDKLDERSCKLTSRWRAKPALQDGVPVEQTLIRSVRWQINRNK